MEVIITHRDPGAVEVALATLDAWQREHDGYYGAPHGACNRASFRTDLDLISPERGGAMVDTGYVPEAQAASVFADLGLDAEISGGWMTSGRNLTLLAVGTSGVIEYRRGRRHGVRQALPCQQGDTWQYLATQCPDESPDAMDLIPVMR